MWQVLVSPLVSLSILAVSQEVEEAGGPSLVVADLKDYRHGAPKKLSNEDSSSAVATEMVQAEAWLHRLK